MKLSLDQEVYIAGIFDRDVTGRPFNLYNSEMLWYEPVFFSILNRINILPALSSSFEYLWQGSMAIINLLLFSVRKSTLDVRIWRL